MSQEPYFHDMEKRRFNFMDDDGGCRHYGREVQTRFYLPTSILCNNDACEHGVGGLVIVNGIGFAWRFIIPDEWMHFFSINFLDCFGASQCVKYKLKGQRLLSISDSMNALSCMDSNKFDPHLQPHHDDLSRQTGK